MRAQAKVRKADPKLLIVKHPVGTGAYKLAEWTLGQRVVFERNKDYYHEGLPRLDQIVFELQHFTG